MSTNSGKGKFYRKLVETIVNLKRYKAMVVGDTEERKIHLMGFVPPKVNETTQDGKRKTHKHKNAEVSNKNNKSF